MKLGVRRVLLAASCWMLTSAQVFGLAIASSTKNSLELDPYSLVQNSSRASCPADVQTLVNLLLRDLPSYANRISQRARRRSRSVDLYSYMLLAGRPEFLPLTLGPGEYTPAAPVAGSEDLQQVFITTLERQYVGNKPVELQHYHWLFFTKTQSGWRLAMMFSQIGGYPAQRPPSPPRDSSQGVVAQAIQLWLRDCRAGTIRPQ
jgi:hypothetical protein